VRVSVLVAWDYVFCHIVEKAKTLVKRSRCVCLRQGKPEPALLFDWHFCLFRAQLDLRSVQNVNELGHECPHVVKRLDGDADSPLVSDL